jgi:hypothetical protein
MPPRESSRPGELATSSYLGAVIVAALVAFIAFFVLPERKRNPFAADIDV